MRRVVLLGLAAASMFGCGGPKDYAAGKTPAQLKAEEQAAIQAEHAKYGVPVGAVAGGGLPVRRSAAGG